MTENSTSGMAEHDPNSAPEMTFRSGAVQEHLYTQYPEVFQPVQPVKPHEAPYAEHSAPEVVAGTSPEPTSPSAISAHDRYSSMSYPNQPVPGSPPPQTNLAGDYKGPYANAYSTAPEAVGQYHNNGQAMYNQYNNGQPMPQYGGPPQNMSHLGYVPPQPGVPSAQNEHKILGLRKKPFWILVVVLAIIVIAAAVGGGVGGALAGKHKNSTPSSASNNGAATTSASTASASSGTSTPTSVLVIPGPTATSQSGTFTPYALATGTRTLDFKFYQNVGVCDTPTKNISTAVYSCPSTVEYILNISGNLQNGYTIANASANLPLFSNIKGLPPNGTDSNTDQVYWEFIINWSENPCDVTRKTEFLIGGTASEYGVVEFTQAEEECTLRNGQTSPAGQICTCEFISSTL